MVTVLVMAAVYPFNAFRLSMATGPILLPAGRPGQADNRQLGRRWALDRPERGIIGVTGNNGRSADGGGRWLSGESARTCGPSDLTAA